MAILVAPSVFTLATAAVSVAGGFVVLEDVVPRRVVRERDCASATAGMIRTRAMASGAIRFITPPMSSVGFRADTILRYKFDKYNRPLPQAVLTLCRSEV